MPFPTGRRPPAPWLSWGLIGLFALQCAGTLAVQSGTADELGAHLPAGILFWKSGSFTGGLANPPLGQLLVAALPVLTGTADHPLDDEPLHVLPARIPSVLLGVATVLAIGALARKLEGRTAGVAAIAAASLSPNLVAHSTLATLDLPVTAFTAFALLLAWRWCERPTSGGLLAFAVAAGTASAIKFTGLHAIPALAAGALLLPGSARTRLSRAGALTGAATAGVVVMAWLSYGPGPGWFLLPAEWVDALREKWQHGQRGHFAYLLGERSANGFPHYFLVALLAKTPLPILTAAMLGALVTLRHRSDGRQGFAALVALPAIWIFTAMSLVHRVDIGLRHVLPVWPVMLALAGVGWTWLWRGGRGSRAAAVALGVALTGSAALTAPNQLAYFHRLAGGSTGGDRVLIDSNLDWGQDDARFRRWAEGRDVHVNPPRPVAGLVAANVNALHGVLRRDDLILRWVTRLPVERRIGRSWRVVRADDAALARAADADPLAALDYAWWLVGVGRPADAIPVLERIEALSSHPTRAAQWWRVRAEALLALGRTADAGHAARRGADPDLAAEIAYRSGAPVDDSRVGLLVAALARRGHESDATALARERLGFDPFDVAGAGRDDADAIARQMDLGREGVALRLAGQRLARAPDDRDALALYGELTVRRKLGLTRFPWPRVDWSGQ